MCVGWMMPIHGLLVCAFVFISMDFVTGVLASFKRARKAGVNWCFESRKAWNTIYKLFFVMGGIILAWIMDACILDFMNLRLAHLFTGFVCGVEFWSYLENAAEISDHAIFRWLGKYMKKQVGNAIEADFNENKRKKKRNGKIF